MSGLKVCYQGDCFLIEVSIRQLLSSFSRLASHEMCYYNLLVLIFLLRTLEALFVRVSMILMMLELVSIYKGVAKGFMKDFNAGFSRAKYPIFDCFYSAAYRHLLYLRSCLSNAIILQDDENVHLQPFFSSWTYKYLYFSA